MRLTEKCLLENGLNGLIWSDDVHPQSLLQRLNKRPAFTTTGYEHCLCLGRDRILRPFVDFFVEAAQNNSLKRSNRDSPAHFPLSGAHLGAPYQSNLHEAS